VHRGSRSLNFLGRNAWIGGCNHPLPMKKLLRSLLAGGAATFADLLVLLFAIHTLHLDARVASIPALVAGGVVNFLGNRHFAFRARAGDV
jgi:putative flippase GtrA